MPPDFFVRKGHTRHWRCVPPCSSSSSSLLRASPLLACRSALSRLARFELHTRCNTCIGTPCTPCCTSAPCVHTHCTLDFARVASSSLLLPVQVGEHFIKDAFSNFVSAPLQNAAVDQVVSAAGVQVGGGGMGTDGKGKGSVQGGGRRNAPGVGVGPRSGCVPGVVAFATRWFGRCGRVRGQVGDVCPRGLCGVLPVPPDTRRRKPRRRARASTTASRSPSRRSRSSTCSTTDCKGGRVSQH